ncbi:MAG: hypothetical protein ACHQFZ_01145 [Acidimicrobiales bacterium]
MRRLGRAFRSVCLASLTLGATLVVGDTASASITITEYPVLTAASQPGDIAAGPDGNVWFTESGANQVAKITPSGTVTEYPVPTAGAQPGFITLGTDGNMWFTENLGDKVARITPTGTITEFPFPTPDSHPFAITSGPDGNIWVTENNNHAVAKVTTSGAIVEYPFPYYSTSITSGPDGNLWITTTSGNEVAKMSTSGALLAQYPAPSGSMGSPAGVNIITTGPNGNLWFTETYVNKVAEVTTSGNFTEFTAPTPNSGPFGVTVGPDGNLWFTEIGANQVAEVTTSGSFTEYPVPTASSNPLLIAVGPDGDIWFTESHGNNVATIKSVPFTYTSGGSFVIGDQSASLGHAVTFWGAQWAADNGVSGGLSPSSFKGFANTPTTSPTCGTKWSSGPGNSSGPPSTVASYTAVIVSNHVTKSGSTISGDAVEIVVVKTNPGYAPAPGHAGTGTVVAVLCG